MTTIPATSVITTGASSVSNALDNTGAVVSSGGVIFVSNGAVIDNRGSWDAQADAYFDWYTGNRSTFNRISRRIACLWHPAGPPGHQPDHR